jgi:hypothetical protein
MLGVGLFLGERSIFGKTYFWKEIPNFGVHTISGKKETCRKRRKKQHSRGKEACRRKINVSRKKKSLTMIGLGFLTNIVTTIIL